jgi:hypothetical protein
MVMCRYRRENVSSMILIIVSAFIKVNLACMMHLEQLPLGRFGRQGNSTKKKTREKHKLSLKEQIFIKKRKTQERETEKMKIQRILKHVLRISFVVNVYSPMWRSDSGFHEPVAKLSEYVGGVEWEGDHSYLQSCALRKPSGRHHHQRPSVQHQG